jgi:outer membrane lipoprotein-sorting protein
VGSAGALAEISRRRIELSDAGGVLSRIEIEEYVQLTGARGRFWFPSRGTWHGINPEDYSPGGRSHYTLRDIEVDQRPDRSAFTLTYPAGCLLVNGDTGEYLYLEKETQATDAPFLRTD